MPNVADRIEDSSILLLTCSDVWLSARDVLILAFVAMYIFFRLQNYKAN